MAISAGTIAASLTLDTTKFSGGLKSSLAMLASLKSGNLSAAESAQVVAKSFNAAGKALTLGLTTPILGAGIAATKVAIDLDTTSRKVATIADASVLSLSDIKAGVRDMSVELGVSTSALNEGLYNVISATNDTGSAMGMLEVATKASVAGFTDQATAVDGLTTVMNAYGMTGAAAMESISDQMLTAQNLGKTTFGEMATSIGNVIPLAAQLKVGTDELFSSIAALTRQGIGTSESITGLRAIFSAIVKPTSEAEKAAEKLGVQFDAAALSAQGLSGFLTGIVEKAGGNTEAIAELFGSVEALNAVLALTGENGAAYFAEAMDGMANSAGATQSAFDMMTEGAQGSLNRVIQLLASIAASFGEIMLPAVESGLSWVSDMLKQFLQLDEGLQRVILGVAAGAAAFGPLLIVLGRLAGVVGLLMAHPVVAAIAGVAAGFIALTAVINSVSSAAQEMGASINGALTDENRANTQAFVDGLHDVSGTVGVTVTPSISIEEPVGNLNQLIFDTLTDGEIDTAAVVAKLHEKIDEVYGKLTADVEANRKAKLAELEKAFNEGVISVEEYGAQVAVLNAKTDEAIAVLDEARAASHAYVDTYAGQATEVVLQTQDQLAAIQQMATDTVGILAEAENALKRIAEIRVAKVKAGVETDLGSITQAFASVQQTYQEKLAEIAKTVSLGQAEIDAAWKEGIDAAGGDAKLVTKVNAETEAATAALKGSAAKLTSEAEGEYKTSIQEMFAGLAAAFPEGAQAISEAVRRLDMLGTVQAAIAESINHTVFQPNMFDLFPTKLQEGLEQAFAGVDFASLNNPQLNNYLAQYNNQIIGEAEALLSQESGANFGKLGDVLRGQIQDGMQGAFDFTEGLDSADFSTQVSALVDSLGLALGKMPPGDVEIPINPTLLLHEDFAFPPEVSAVVAQSAQDVLAGEDISPAGRQWIGSLAGGMADNAGIATGAGINVAGLVVAALAGQNGAMSDTGATGVAGYVSAVEDGEGGASRAGTGVSRAAVQAMSSQNGGAYSAGSGIVSAMISGVNNKSGALYAAVRRVVASAIAAARSAAGGAGGGGGGGDGKAGGVQKAYAYNGIAKRAGYDGIFDGIMTRGDANNARDGQPLYRPRDEAALAGATNGPAITINFNNAILRDEGDARRLARLLGGYLSGANYGRG